MKATEAAEKIVPEKVYSLRDATHLIPSPRGGRISMRTLHRQIHSGKLRAFARLANGKRFWCVYGEAILDFLGTPGAPEVKPRGPTAAQKARAEAIANEKLRRRGIID